MTDTLGYRKIFGALVPAFNTVVEPELAALRPPGITHQTARFTLEADVLDQVQRAAAGLASAGVDALMVGLSTESIPGGLDLLEQAMSDAGQRAERPVHAASFATFAALERLGATTVAIVTPFDEAANQTVRETYEARGLTVAAAEGLAWPSIETIGQATADQVRGLFQRVRGVRADAVVQVGTGLPVLALLQEMENDLGMPVVAANAALYWQTLRAAGVGDAIEGYGRLLGIGGST